MKTILFAIVALASSAAMAYPALKDSATFNGVYSGAAGGSIDFVQTLELIGFDSAASTYTLKNTVVYNGQSNVQNQDVSADQLLTNDRVANILANCSQMGGSPEAVTVPAGTFNSCKVPQERGSMIWVADVPFGFAKEIFIDEEGNKTEMEMTSFVHGK